MMCISNALHISISCHTQYKYFVCAWPFTQKAWVCLPCNTHIHSPPKSMKHNQICISTLHNNKKLGTQQKSSQGCPITAKQGWVYPRPYKNCICRKKNIMTTGDIRSCSNPQLVNRTRTLVNHTCTVVNHTRTQVNHTCIRLVSTASCVCAISVVVNHTVICSQPHSES